MQTTIILLSIIVGILSIVILALLGALVMLLIRLNTLVKKVDNIATNVVSASAWLSPTKVFSEIKKLFSK